MIGYHYTAERNWNDIKRNGLIPYTISHPELDALFNQTIKGVWVWKNQPVKDSHAGTILYQVATKQTTKVIRLQIKYNENDLLKYNASRIELPHQGIMGNWVYHQEEVGLIHTKIVKPANIKLLDIYDILKRLA